MKICLKKQFVLLLFGAVWALSNPAYSQTNWPEITRYSKPWTRWWWPGSAECFAEMSDALAKAMIEMIKIGNHE
jgi:hypothetical protein